MNMKRLVLIGLFAAAVASMANAQEKFTYVDLVNRLTDLEHLATLPQPGETTKQWSSYDRASKYDEQTGKYVAWGANGDGGGIIRKEGNDLVFAEMEGPGCIWRTWSAKPMEGHVRIYLDGATEPVVDLPFAGYFDGKNEPFTRPALVHTVAKGCNNYTPIPYQKSCKIVADEKWGSYFQFVYTTFPKVTQVPTFKRELSSEENKALDEANKILTHCGPREFPKGHSSNGGEGLIGPGTTQTKIEGPAAINCIRVKFDPPLTPADRDVLREMVLRIKWDGETTPSVWTPLGDFFGTAPGANAYRSLPCGVTEDGWFYANWFMPFAKSAEVAIINEGEQQRMKYQIFSEQLKGDLSKYARFHAKWHRDEFLPTEPERKIDWTMLKTTGRGRFVGVMLHVWNPRGGWWGEGDEKFFVDGEKFPSTIGTGSEDYFGYAWCDPGLFQNAYHNQTYNDGNNKGHVSVNRWHVTDQIPFQKSFAGDIEKYYPNARPTLYASTVYWYLEPGGQDPYQPVPLANRIGYCVTPASMRVPGALEGEKLKVLAKTSGITKEHGTFDFGDKWSDDAHLRWAEVRLGDKLDLALPVATTGRFKLLAQMTKDNRYGIVQLSLDGKKIGEPIDLYSEKVVPTGELNFGTHELTAGEHKLSVEMIGANPKAAKKFNMFGLDYVKLVPAQ
jgi:hypothetical protein